MAAISQKYPEKKSQVAVVMLPIPTQSHLHQLLQLAAVISSSGRLLPVHFLGSATHNRQARLRGAATLKPETLARIHFHDLPTLPIASPAPDPNAPDRIPVHNAPAIHAYLNLRRQVGEFVKELSENVRKIVIIHDRLVAEAVGDTVSIPNVETYAFNCLSGFTLFHLLWESRGKPFDFQGELSSLEPVAEIFPGHITNFIVNKPDFFEERAGDIHNTSRVIEGEYIDLLARKEISGGKKHWAIRPLILQDKSNDDTKTRHKCLDWLDKQAPRSVIYVSFGSLVELSEDEVREIATGLEQSKQKFIWVLRNADRADIFAGDGERIELPEGFEERVRDDGLVVRDWAPQLEILVHKSTGGFMSHCGWNSCYESFTTGVPIAAWPMHSDQPLNAVFVTRVLKTGLIVREWDQRKEPVKSLVVKNVVERLISSKEGDEIRKRAEEISAAINESMEEGGEFCRELEGFIAHITR